MSILPDLAYENVWMVFEQTSTGMSCVGSFADWKQAYYAAADIEGIVIPGTKIVYANLVQYSQNIER